MHAYARFRGVCYTSGSTDQEVRMSTHVGAQREGTTTNVVLVVAGVVAGFLHPIAGVLASVVLAVVAKNRTIRIVLIALTVVWLFYVVFAMPWSGSGTSGGSSPVSAS